MSGLTGKNAFVTGASGAIGGCTAVRLAEAGCNVFLTGRNREALDALVSRCARFDVRVEQRSADCAEPSGRRRVADEALSTFGVIDILVNAAGVFPRATLFESDDALTSETFEVNFFAALDFSRKFAGDMVEKRWGRIVNIGSSSAYNGFAGSALYCATKHALLGLSKSLHDELRPANVRVHHISPSSTQSAMGATTKDQDFTTFLDPDDVAQMVMVALSFDGNMVIDDVLLKRMAYR